MEMTYTPNTLDYMFRYLEKFVGKYRILAHIDEETNKFPTSEDYEDFYIPCNNGCEIKSTYLGDDILALCFYDKYSTAKNVSKKLSEMKIEHEDDITDTCIDAHIYFNAKDMDKVAKLVKAKTSGKQISPMSTRNLKKTKSTRYIIPKEDLDKLYKNTNDMGRTEKLHFFKKANREYITKLDKETKQNNKEKMKIDGLGTKEYIHSIGYWDKYVRFINKMLKN